MLSAQSDDDQMEELLELIQSQHPMDQDNNTVDEGDDETYDQNDDEDDSVAGDDIFNTWKDRQDKLFMLSSRCSWEAGPIYCEICNNEENMPNSRPHQGINMFIKHLITAHRSHLSTASFGAGTPGRHSMYSVFMRQMVVHNQQQDLFVCQAQGCEYSAATADRVRAHVRKSHWDGFPGEIAEEDIYHLIQEYFMDHFMFPLKATEIGEISAYLDEAGNKRREKDRQKKHRTM